jgi:hypothetical protein
MTIYIGWVPTVGRRLSYSIIGNSSHPSVAEIANVADAKKRRILCLQKRTLLDTALPIFKSTLVESFFDLTGSFWFFLDAQSSNDFSSGDQSLTGNLYLFIDQVDEDVNKKVLSIKSAINKLNNFDTPSFPRSIDDCYSKISKECLSDIEKYSILTACFRLDRDGIIEIEADSSIGIDETDKELEHTICAQLFFFVKDISHRHQHHHPKTDTILDVYRKDHPHWQDEMLRSLYKKVLDFKRSRNEWVYSSALGVLSYIKAFKKVCKERRIKITAGRDDEDLSESIKTTQNELRHITSQKVGFRNALITITLAIIGAMLMLSSLGAVQKPALDIKANDEFVKSVADSIINNPYNTFLGTLIVSLSISTYIYNDYYFGKLNWIKDVGRLFMSIKNQTFSGALMIAISLIIALVTFGVFNLFDDLKSIFL